MPKSEAGLWRGIFMSPAPHNIHSLTWTPPPTYAAAGGQNTVNHNRIVTVYVHLTSAPNPQLKMILTYIQLELCQ